jgi:membrane protease subunit (stomatin/prohibitin family)
MSFCTQCGSQLVAGAKFCSNCGKPSIVASNICTACSTTFQPGQKFCTSCGNPLVSTMAPPASPLASFPPPAFHYPPANAPSPVISPSNLGLQKHPDLIQNFGSSSGNKVCINCGGDLVGKNCSIC